MFDEVVYGVCELLGGECGEFAVLLFCLVDECGECVVKCGDVAGSDCDFHWWFSFSFFSFGLGGVVIQPFVRPYSSHIW